MAKVIDIFRLVNAPTERQTATGTAITNVRLACSRRMKRDGQPDADFWDATIFGERGKAFAKYLKKGDPVFISGEMQNDNYTNREGVKVNHDIIIVEDFKFVGSKKDGEAGKAPAAAPANKPAQAAQAAPAPAEDPGPVYDQYEDEDLPFA